MIQPISQICTACMGLGVVEGTQKIIRNPNNKLDIPIEEEFDRDSNVCYICGGDGHIPTGLFIYLPNIISKGRGLVSPSFLEELEELPEDLQRVIKSKI